MTVSVVIPTYNRSDLVCEAIDSVLGQSYQDIEVIVVNDGSTDDTEQKLARYADRIQYVRQPNAGVNNARNHGVSLASGDYIATLDNDDLWRPYKLALQVDILERFPELAFTFSNFAVYKNADDISYDGIRNWFNDTCNWSDLFDKSLPVSEFAPAFSEQVDAASRLYMGSIYGASLGHYFVLPSTALIRRSMIPEDVKFVEHDSVCGDWDYFARLSKHHPVAYLDHETTYNRSHEDEFRLTRTDWKQQLTHRIDMIERLYMQDEPFYSENSYEIDSIYRSRLFALCRQLLLQGEREQARLALQKTRGHRPLLCPQYMALSTACHIPGMPWILRMLRNLRG